MQKSFSARQIVARIQWSILTNPEDLRPENCILNNERNKCDVVGIDSERTFGESYKKNGETVTRSHSVFYSFPEMDSPMPPRSFVIPPSELKLWLIQIAEEHLYQVNLSHHVRTGSKSILGVPITSARLNEIYTKIVKIAVCMANGKTLMDVLTDTNPRLAKVYNATRPNGKSLESIGNCIRAIDGGRMEDHTPPSAGNIHDYLGEATSVFDDAESLCKFLRALNNVSTPTISKQTISDYTAAPTSCAMVVYKPATRFLTTSGSEEYGDSEGIPHTIIASAMP